MRSERVSSDVVSHATLPKTSWECRLRHSRVLSSEKTYETDKLSGRQALLARGAAAGAAGVHPERAVQLLSARRYDDGLAAGRRGALRRRHGGAVGLAVYAAGLRAVLRHERVRLAVLGRQGSQGHPPRARHGAFEQSGRVVFVHGRGACRAALGHRAVQSGRRRHRGGLPVSDHRLLLVSGGGADECALCGPAQHRTGQAADVRRRHHHGRKRVR